MTYKLGVAIRRPNKTVWISALLGVECALVVLYLMNLENVIGGLK